MKYNQEYKHIKKFFNFFQEEIQTKNKDKEFLDYYFYSNLMSNNKTVRTIAIHRFEEKLLLILELIMRFRNNCPTILDAGCGYGTESILFASSGAKVLGIDLKLQRIDCAKKRVKFYESKFQQTLNITFKNTDIFSELFSLKNYFDFAFAMESISHIHPAENFLKAVYRSLKDSGILIISESNPCNPLVWFHFFKEHLKYGRHTILVDPITGKRTNYAVEREFYIKKLHNLLIEHGFAVKSLYPVDFIPGIKYIPTILMRWLDNILPIATIEERLAHIPYIKSFAQTYTILASKRTI